MIVIKNGPEFNKIYATVAYDDLRNPTYNKIRVVEQCDDIDIPRINLPHKNKSKHDHYSRCYDDEARAIVADRYGDDIREFGYKFETQ